jgi:hypothetical protein
MHRVRKTAEELEVIGLLRIHARPGCRGVSSMTLTLDEDGEWYFSYEAGSADVDITGRAAIAISHQMHDEFYLITDT